jgi:uncharacterized lipoprotein YbaY
MTRARASRAQHEAPSSMNRRSLLSVGSGLAAAIALAACSSTSSTAAPGASAGVSLAIPSVAVPSLTVPSIALPSGLPSSLPSIALPSGLPSIVLPSGSFAIPSVSFPSEDKDLEGRLPSQLNGVTLTKYSVKGSESFDQNDSASQELSTCLGSVGKTPNDFSAAFAGDLSQKLNIQIAAFRAAGADGGKLLSCLIDASKKDAPDAQITQASVGGKNVTEINDPSNTDQGLTYLYSNGDTIFFVQTPDSGLAGSALQEMP